MANSVQSVRGVAPGAGQAPKKSAAPSAAPSNSGSPRDRIARQSDPLPALLLGAAAAAQLVPGVVEAEGATGAATVMGIAIRSATANPVAKALIAAGAGAAGSYAKSLVHDATAGQPAFAGITDLGHALDVSVHAGLGIPPSEAR